MAISIKKWTRIILIGGNMLVVFLLLLVALIPFLDAGRFWFIAVLGLFFPVLLAVNILFLLGWLIARSRWAFLSLVMLLLSWQQVSVLLGFHFFQEKFQAVKAPGTVRVLSWNVIRWDEHNRKARGGASYRIPMMEVIARQDADILCLQEFFEPRTSRYFRQNIDTLKSMGYLYHHFFPISITVNGEYQYGMIILSKYPIIDSAKTNFGNTPHSEGLIYADIKIKEQVFRVFSVHMESFRMSRHRYFGRNALSSLRMAYRYRSQQAREVKKQVEASPHPVILCGNLGDIPNSYAYFKVRGGMQDAFLKEGKGLGRTFRFVSPTLRIEYIFADKKFGISQYSQPPVTYSDHYPLVADLEFPGLKEVR